MSEYPSNWDDIPEREPLPQRSGGVVLESKVRIWTRSKSRITLTSRSRLSGS